MKLAPAIPLVAAIALAACAAPSTPAASEIALVASTHASDAPPRVPTRCTQHEFGLIGEGDVVRVQRSDGVVLERPGGMQSYVPVGLGCAQTSGGDEYLVVQYGEVPLGCKVCEWVFVYDHAGRPMHDSVPAFWGQGDTLAPNNAGYARVSQELGLQRPRIEYDETRRVTID